MAPFLRCLVLFTVELNIGRLTCRITCERGDDAVKYKDSLGNWLKTQRGEAPRLEKQIQKVQPAAIAAVCGMHVRSTQKGYSSLLLCTEVQETPCGKRNLSSGNLPNSVDSFKSPSSRSKSGLHAAETMLNTPWTSHREFRLAS